MNRQLLAQSKTLGQIRLMGTHSSGSGVLQFGVPITPSGTANAVSNTGLVTANEWNFAAVKYDSSDSQDVRLYHGDLSTLVTEVTYASNVDGTIQSDNASAFIIGRDVAGSLPFTGDIASILVFPNTALTLGQIRTLQYRPHSIAGIELFVHYGFNGSGSQIDRSGQGNNGTVTGATVAPHVPIDVRQVRRIIVVPAVAAVFTAAVISAGVGVDDATVPVSLDSDDATADEHELHASTTIGFTPGAGTLKVDNITPGGTPKQVNWSGPAADTNYELVIVSKKAGESDVESNRVQIKTAPARPTNIQVS